MEIDNQAEPVGASAAPRVSKKCYNLNLNVLYMFCFIARGKPRQMGHVTRVHPVRAHKTE
jgi:hypothetical protein